MSVLRTPDEQFVNLPGYQFTPNYVQVETKGVAALRMHYVDVGPADGPAVVLLHGQPTWSFLYRDVIHVLREAGLRVIAPDHIGFGRSDKLTEQLLGELRFVVEDENCAVGASWAPNVRPLRNLGRIFAVPARSALNGANFRVSPLFPFG